jgi:hypothetical protein
MITLTAAARARNIFFFFYTPFFSPVLLPFGRGLEKNFGLFWMLLLDVALISSLLLTLAVMEVLRPHSQSLDTILVPLNDEAADTDQCSASACR